MFFVQSRITSVLVSIENIFSPKSSISSALNKGWGPRSQAVAGEARRGDSAGEKKKFPAKPDQKRWTKRKFVYSDI